MTRGSRTKMSKRGPQPSVSHENKVKTLKNFQIFDASKKVKKESDPVWQEVCDFINNHYNPEKKMTKRNIQNYVQQNRNGIIFDLLQENVLNKKSNNDDINEIDSVDKNFKQNINEEKELLVLQNNVMYKPIIREVTTFPFNIFHWSMEAIDFASNISTSIEYIFRRVGCFCKPFKLPDGTNTKQIYLFSLGVTVCDEFVPICQLSTEEYCVTIFKRFLNEILRSGIPVPKTLILDHHHSLYIAANQVYNLNVSFEKYLSLCFSYLTENKMNSLPSCLIHTDVRLLIVTALNWNCIRTVPLNSIKYFYIYCIALLSFQSRLLDFEEVLEKIFVLALSEFQSKTTKDFFNDLMLKIKELNIEEIYSEKNIKIIQDEFANFLDSDDVLDQINYDECIHILNYIVNIVERAKQWTMIQGIECERNALYNKDVCKNLIKCCTTFIIWTKVMYKSNTEENSCYQSLNSYRIDFGSFLVKEISSEPSVITYLLKNIEYSEVILQKAKSFIYSSKMLTAKQSNKIEYLLYNENWMGHNDIDSEDSEVSNSNSSSGKSEGSISSENELDLEIDHSHDLDIESIIDSFCKESFLQKSLESCDDNISFESDNKISNSFISKTESTSKNNIKRGIYLTACPEIDVINQKPNSKKKNRKIIKNYNLLKPKSLKKKQFFVVTSSFFDSFMEILVSSYFNAQNFQNSIDEFSEILTKTKTDFLNLFKEYVRTFNITKLYTARFKLIIEICESINNKLTWTKSISEFIECVMYPNIFAKIKCVHCITINYQYFNCIKLSLEELSSTNLSKIIDDCLMTIIKVCDVCSKTDLVCEYSIKDFFCIDTEKIFNKRPSIELKHLVPHLIIRNEKFILTGAIGYEEPIGNNNLCHYIAYARSLQGSWKKYDNTNIETSMPEKMNINSCINAALLLYIKYDVIKEEKNDSHFLDQIHDKEIIDVSNQNFVNQGSCEQDYDKSAICNRNIEVDKCSVVESLSTHLHFQNYFSSADTFVNEEIKSLIEDKSVIQEKSFTEESLDDSYNEKNWTNESVSSLDFSISMHDYAIKFHDWRNLIQNGSVLPPMKSLNQDVKLINTCPIDSIIEVFTAASCFECSFRDLIYGVDISSSNKHNKVFEIIRNYVLSQSKKGYYLMRLEFCKSIPELYLQRKISDYLEIDCRDNVVRLFESIMADEYSFQKKIKCTCNYANVKTFCIYTINTDLTSNDSSVKLIKNFVEENFSRKTKVCYNCKGEAFISYKMASYFCIELETNFLMYKDMEYHLNSIPIRLNLCKEQYNLIGVIALKLPYDYNDLMHYYTFIRSPNGEWEERNNLEKNILIHSKKSTIKARLALIFYARKNCYKKKLI